MSDRRRVYISFVHVVIPGTVIDGLDAYSVMAIDDFMLSLGIIRNTFLSEGHYL